jgi:hypothetical protein
METPLRVQPRVDVKWPGIPGSIILVALVANCFPPTIKKRGAP